MKYDIPKAVAPKVLNLGKGTECLQLLLSQASKNKHKPLVSMIFPIFGAHVLSSKFHYTDLVWKERSGKMANLVAENGGNKGLLSYLVHHQLPFGCYS